MITKSDFLKFKKHPAWLWLAKNDPQKLPKPDENLQQKFKDGTKLEALAEQRFPNLQPSPSQGFQPNQAYKQHKFQNQDFECTTDIVLTDDQGHLTLIEIKASSSAKDDHIPDLAFQQIVAQSQGHIVKATQVLHLSSQYALAGAPDPHYLFALTDATSKVAKILDKTAQEMAQALAIATAPQGPEISPRHCGPGNAKQDWLPIFTTLQQLPETSIYDLPSITPQQIGELEDLQIQLIQDIPETFKLTPKQQQVRRLLKSNTPQIDHQKVQDFLKNLQYPLYFLDYETLALAVPHYQGTKPYQQVTFQFSLHIQPAPNADLEHHEYLHHSEDHPLPKIAESLQSLIKDKGSVIVWYQLFEKTRNQEIAQHLPQFKSFFDGINARTVDLMEPFKQGHYDHPQFLGSASIKKVLPVLVPTLSYQEIAIHEGESASRLWRQAVVENAFDPQTKAQTLQDLRDYCKLDTLAMVKILEALQSL